MKNLACCFIGHREIIETNELKTNLIQIIEDLIVNKKVAIFLFGSKSQFNDLCLSVVTELKEKYSYIKRIKYTCKSESCILESEKDEWQKIFSNLYKQDVEVLAVEEEFEHKTKYTVGKASYVERNQAMIDDSDYCIFYYDEDYQPKARKYSKNSIGYYQPKSGTKLSYDYAKRKKKFIINCFK